MTINLFGHDWYFRLKRPTTGFIRGKVLHDDFDRKNLRNKLLIQLEIDKRYINPRTQDVKKVRLFGVFNSCQQFVDYQQRFPENDRCFYEVILGENPLKPFFDIDISSDQYDGKCPIDEYGEQIKDEVIENLIKILEPYGFQLDYHMLVFTSHGTTDTDVNASSSSVSSKRSYHLIIRDFYFTNYQFMKNLCNKIIKNINPEYVKYIDKSIYSELRQFRIVGSQKWHSGRVKILNALWYYKGKPITLKNQPMNWEQLFETTLVGVMNKDMTVLPSGDFQDGEQHILRPEKQYSSFDLTAEEVEHAILLLNKMITGDGKSPCVIQEIKQRLIILKRTKPSYCENCKRIHEHENPFIYVSNKDDISNKCNVYYYCRRSTQGKFIGSINVDPFSNLYRDDGGKIREIVEDITGETINHLNQLINQDPSTILNKIDKRKKFDMADYFV